MRITVTSWLDRQSRGGETPHRRVRRLFRRSICTCGDKWPCPDHVGWPPGTPIPDGTHRGVVLPTWHGATVLSLPQVGRAGTLTPAQRDRAGVR